MGRPDLAAASMQRVILHVAGADLEDVGVFGDEGNIVFAHHFGDDGEACLRARLGEQFEAGETEALECVRRAAGLECAAAKNMGTVLADMMSDGEDLLFGFNRTGTGHGDEIAATDLEVQHPHNCLLVL